MYLVGIGMGGLENDAKVKGMKGVRWWMKILVLPIAVSFNK